MIVTTSETVEGKQIRQHLGLVTGEAILGIVFTKDIFARVRDIFGGRVKGYEKELFQAMKMALERMLERSGELGANAIVGVRFEVEVMSPRGEGTVIMVLCYGTAVELG